MELLPIEVIETELLPHLDPVSFLNYSSINKLSVKLCNGQVFWQTKVSNTPRRELQNDWLLFFAKQSKLNLITKLIAGADTKNVIIDNIIVCYAVLYILETREELLTNQVDPLLAKLIARGDLKSFIGEDAPENFIKDMKNWVAMFRHRVSLISEGGPLPCFEGYSLQLGYLSEYTVGYYYRKTVDIIPRLETYATEMLFLIKLGNLGGAVIIFDFTRSLVREISKHRDGIKIIYNFLKYIEQNEEFKNVHVSLRFTNSYYDFVILWALENGTYADIEALNSGILWYRQGRLITPLDPKIYYEVVKLSNYDESQLRQGYRCLDAEEHVKYIKTLSQTGLISFPSMISLLRDIEKHAIWDGYTYLSMVCKRELQILSREHPII